jgi:hypothetical protein
MGKADAKKTRKYTKDQLDQALSQAKSSGKIRAAAKLFKIPFSTLHDKISGKYAKETRGPNTILTPEEEERTIEWIKYMAKAGFPVMQKDLQINISNLAKTLRKKGCEIPETFPSKF